ncbi:MAG: molybdopterin-dependent oxidoreductase [Chloroflexi bacterium]|nr:molybdopterin-dependent oxidoreductase [Chloroflexota bacterium]
MSGLSSDELFEPRPLPDAPHLVRSWGFAAAYKNTGLGGGAPDISGADVELYEDGTFEVRSSAAELGQGLVTVMRLTVAEEMGVEPDMVRVLVMDTDLTPNGGPTTASPPDFCDGQRLPLCGENPTRGNCRFDGGEVRCAPRTDSF